MPALAGQEKYPLAEPQLIAGYEGLKAREAKIPPPARGRLRRRGPDRPVLRSRGRPEKAAEWRKAGPEHGGRPEALTPRRDLGGGQGLPFQYC